MENIYKQLGGRIREIRKKKSLTLEELSDRADLDWSFLARIETGKGIASVQSLMKISKALNVSIGDLFSNVSFSQDKLLDQHIGSLLRTLKVSDKLKLIKILKILLS